MSKWPEGVPFPSWPETPEGITQQEFAWYLASDPNRKPELRDKIEAAMGWKKDDVDDAREIAEQVLGAVKIAEKGHVPEENRFRYRIRKDIADSFKSLAGRVSGIGEYGDANTLFALELKYKRLANELRVDLPRKEDKNEHHD